jgi:predicted helicase
LQKEHIFHYVYAVLHNPAYRKKYELNLKRDFPRIPLYDDFNKWTRWGEELMNLHIDYEKVKKYGLERKDVINEGETKPFNEYLDTTADKNLKPPKPKLKADKENGIIFIDSQTTLTGVPAIAWEYKLGNRSALEWILDQYKEKKPRDATIREKFNNYKFADYKEEVIDLLMRVCTVSVRTMEIVREMEAESEIGEDKS